MLSKVFYFCMYFVNLCTSRIKADICSEVAFNWCRIKGKGNKLTVRRAKMKDCTFRIAGQNNQFSCQSLFKKSHIHIEGDNNKVIIEQGGELRHIDLWIRGCGNEIRIGNDVIFNGGRIVCVGTNNWVEIGDGCMFADRIEIWASDTHPIYKDGQLINQSRPITIGRNVWLGTNVSILKGSRLHDGCVIGMGSVVSGEIPARTICVGNPARVIKENVTWDKSTIPV